MTPRRLGETRRPTPAGHLRVRVARFTKAAPLENVMENTVKIMATQDQLTRILVVEDDPHIQLLLRHLLRPWFELELAVTVDEALTMAAQHAYDLFLVDINLGTGRTGVDLLWALRQMPGYSATPVVSCTAYALRGDRDRFLSYGFDEHIDKPFEPRQLHAMLESALSRRPAA